MRYLVNDMTQFCIDIWVQAEFVREWVGLRPGRPSVRLEIQPERASGLRKVMPVIHNYGHGGAGLTLSWGCAGHVLEILDDWLRQRKTKTASKL